MQSVVRYIQRVGIAFSILFNTLTGGPSNQTFSARNYAWKRQGKPNLVYIIDKMWYYSPNHCMESWIYWRVRRDVQYEYEQYIMERENESRPEQGYPYRL